jgi:hypothetical protein
MDQMKTLRYARVSVVGALLGLAVIAGAFAAGTRESQASHAGGMDAMSVDLNISGNTASGLGPGHTEAVGALDTELDVTPCDQLVLDIVASGVPGSDPMVGFGFALTYEDSSIEILSADTGFMLEATAGSTVFNPGLTFNPDSVGVAAADLGVAGGETGSGVLARMTGQIRPQASSGALPLTPTEAAHINGSNDALPPDAIGSGTLNVDGSCNGDVDCSLTINSVDALKLLRSNAALSVTQTEPCDDIGSDIGPRLQGDVDCNGTVNSVDSLRILRAVAALSVSLNPGCQVMQP